ncbi:flagellin [Alicyclobacillus ferrooxydans]|uniref:Flagellin n=1 Tax=Alicyclobacillus ferrooxydans TaxID=471514 RepID=A0A0P9D4G7_9BACL|nr:flagellin [Alicyclobacillus ferrooxydans]KPV44363.1 hypothetical protein AN477_06940 [Alicyclobacillus ferrooxydans]
MRVTTFGMTANYLNDLTNIMQKLQNTEQEASTGNRINQPSDDPVGYSADVATQSMIKNTQQWINNAKFATSSMQVASDAIGSLQSMLGKIRTQLVTATNGTNTPQDLQQMATVVKQYIGSVQSIANTSNGEQYIFAGTNGNSAPLSGDVTSGFLWGGNNKSQNTNIGNGTKLQVNTDVSAVFNGNSSASQNLMKNLTNIYQDLSAGNQSNLQTDLGNLDSNISNVTAVQSDLGGRMDRAQAANSQLSSMLLTLQNQQSQLQDANMADVITSLTREQTVYTAALNVGAKMILPTLASVLP